MPLFCAGRESESMLPTFASASAQARAKQKKSREGIALPVQLVKKFTGFAAIDDK